MVLKHINFGGWKIRSSEVFFTSKFCFGIVNYKPILDGHVLILPRRELPRLADLTPEEQTDFFQSVVIVSQKLESIFNATSLTITIQDGTEAGQTVRHLHCHLIPRYKGDYLSNDDIYADLENTTLVPGNEPKQERPRKGPDSNREPRSTEAMAEEAAMLRPLFPQFEDIWQE